MNQLAVVEQSPTYLQSLVTAHKDRQARFKQAALNRKPKDDNSRTILLNKPDIKKMSSREINEHWEEAVKEWVKSEEARQRRVDEHRLRRLRILQDKQSRSLERISLEVSKKYRAYGVAFSDLFSSRRHKMCVLARQECFWRARQETSHSFPVIGKYFGDRDHTTVLHGVRRYSSIQQFLAGNIENPLKKITIPNELIIPLEAVE